MGLLVVAGMAMFFDVVKCSKSGPESSELTHGLDDNYGAEIRVSRPQSDLKFVSVVKCESYYSTILTRGRFKWTAK